MTFAQTFRKILGDFTESKTQNFQKDSEYVPKISLWELLCFFFVVTKENCFENFLRSLYLEQYVLFVQMQSLISAAPVLGGYVWYFGSFTSCVWDVLGYRILRKTVFFLEQTRNFPNWRWVRSRNVCLSSALLFALVVTKKYVLRTSWVSLLEILRVFCSNAESGFGCASSRRLRLVLWLFTSCVRDVLWYRILIKVAFDFFRKRGLRRFVLCAKVLMSFVRTCRKKLGDFTDRKTQSFQNDVE